MIGEFRDVIYTDIVKVSQPDDKVCPNGNTAQLIVPIGAQRHAGAARHFCYEMLFYKNF